MESCTDDPLPELHYEQVLKEESPTKLVRYIAKEKQSDGSFEPTTVSRWISLLTHPTRDYSNRAISQFSQILRDSDQKAFFFETKGVNHHTAQQTSFEFVLIESDYLYQFADAQHDDSDFGHLVHQPPTAPAVVFPNLGGDSLLIAPTAMDQDSKHCPKADTTPKEAWWINKLVQQHHHTQSRAGDEDSSVSSIEDPSVNSEGAKNTTKSAESTNSQRQNVYGHLGAFLRRAPVEQVVPFWRLSLETLWNQLEKNPSQTYWFSTDGTGVNWLHMRIDPRPKYYSYGPFRRK